MGVVHIPAIVYNDASKSDSIELLLYLFFPASAKDHQGRALERRAPLSYMACVFVKWMQLLTVDPMLPASIHTYSVFYFSESWDLQTQ